MQNRTANTENERVTKRHLYTADQQNGITRSLSNTKTSIKTKFSKPAVQHRLQLNTTHICNIAVHFVTRPSIKAHVMGFSGKLRTVLYRTSLRLFWQLCSGNAVHRPTGIDRVLQELGRDPFKSPDLGSWSSHQIRIPQKILIATDSCIAVND